MKNMMMIGALLVLGACAAANNAADQVARQQAKSVVNGIVSSRLPGVNVAPVTDCIIDAASASEIVQVGSASVTGVTQETVTQVLQIAQRPQSTDCIAQNSSRLLSGLLAG